MNTFKLSDYDCIGFDLDYTLVKFNISNSLFLKCKLISNFLVEKKGYSSKYLSLPITTEDLDFVQKGLFIDIPKGNILKLSSDGKIQIAFHGTKALNSEEIEKYYPNHEWEISKKFFENPLLAFGNPKYLKLRPFCDYFDIPATLVYAKAVDTINEDNGNVPINEYGKIWSDILEAAIDMYSREQFQPNKGNYFPEIKANVSKYINKCDPDTLNWIKELKKTKKIFLITGSNSDFANFTATYTFGDDWKSLFDIIICYANKKSAFFTETRPFYTLINSFEDETISGKNLKVGGVYNQGNWKELYEFLSRLSGKDNPKCIYMGDNLLQDVYAPNKYTNLDTIAVVDEQLAEGILHHELSHIDEEIINSNQWGSFFCFENTKTDSFWNSIIRKHAKICIPSVSVLAKIPMDKEICCFNPETNDFNGYYPNKPKSLINFGE